MKMTPQQLAWLKGAEMAVGGGVVSAVLQAFQAGGLPHTKTGWAEFGGIIVASAYGALRLYLTQSPIQNVVSSTTEKEVLDLAAGVAEKVTKTTTTELSPAAPVVTFPKIPLENLGMHTSELPADHGADG